MKDFALKLSCLNEDRIKVENLAISRGFEFADEDKFCNDYFYLRVRPDRKSLYYFHELSKNATITIYQMPRDWNKIQEALVVEAKKQINYKDYIKRTDLLVENAELKQTIKTLSHTADILAQENAELIKDNKYWKDRNEKQETLYNNTLVVNCKIVRDKELLQRKIRDISSVSCNM